MKFFLLFIIFLCSFNLKAQTSISGKVIDEKTNEGIADVSIYLNNSSCGTQTDAQGNFKLSCERITGKSEIVFSHLAYEKKIAVFEYNKGENLIIILKASQFNLNEVVIKSKQSKADLTKWIDLFTRNFIGNYNLSSRQCKIMNTEVLYFDFERKENILKAYARAPLLIENTYTGYRIRLDLDQFEYSFNTNRVLYVYSSLYSDLPKKDIAQEERIKKNRRDYYYGSTMHFMRSLYMNNPFKEGFWIFKFKSVKNEEKLRVNTIVNAKIAEAYAGEITPNTTLNHFFSNDTVSYYLSVMNQNDVLKVDTVPIGVSKITIKNKTLGTVNFNFQDTLLVYYQKNFPRPIPGAKIKLDLNRPIKPVFLSTFMTFFKQGGVNIERNGFYPEMSLFMFGDMSNRRLAWALPFDYDPDSP